jgi:hypothetical protein
VSTQGRAPVKLGALCPRSGRGRSDLPLETPPILPHVGGKEYDPLHKHGVPMLPSMSDEHITDREISDLLKHVLDDLQRVTTIIKALAVRLEDVQNRLIVKQEGAPSSIWEA